MDWPKEFEKFTRHGGGALTAGNANAFAAAWQNPEPYAIRVIRVIMFIDTAGGTAGATMDIGSAADATTHGTDIIIDAPIDVIGPHTTNEVVNLDARGGATDYITFQILDQNAASLVGSYYIEYVKRI